MYFTLLNLSVIVKRIRTCHPQICHFWQKCYFGLEAIEKQEILKELSTCSYLPKSGLKFAPLSQEKEVGSEMSLHNKFW